MRIALSVFSLVISLGAGSAALATGCLDNEGGDYVACNAWRTVGDTRVGPVLDPRDTPKTAYPGYANGVSAAGQDVHVQRGIYESHHTHAGAAVPANVWTPPAHYIQSPPVIVGHDNYAGHEGYSYDYYQSAAPYLEGNTQISAPICDHHSVPARPACAAPLNGCFTIGANGQNYPAPCPRGGYVSSASYQQAPAPVMAQASAHAEASVITNGFLNGLNGGVGVIPSFYGGGGSAIISSGGHGSVLGRAPLLRFGGRRHGGGGHMGGGCGCMGGHMGGGGGD